MSNRLGRNPFGPKTSPAASQSPADAADSVAPKAATAPTYVPEFSHTEVDEVLELSSLRDFLIKDVPAAALMLAIKGAGRLSAQLRRYH